MSFVGKGKNLDGSVYHVLTTDIGAQVVLDVIGFRNVLGLIFYHADFLTVSGSSEVAFWVKTGNYPTRFWWEFLIGEDLGKMECYFYRNSDVSGGSEISLLNRNMTSDKTTDMKFYKNPTIIDYGEQIESLHVDATRKGRGEMFDIPDFVLKENSNYLVVVKNVSSSDMIVNHKFLFTEIGRWE